jgi:leader peptidase (prepilin peptidase)/N-methyltransferase
VELAGAFCALISLWRFGPTVTGLASTLFLVNLIVIGTVDWRHMIIPHTLTVGGMGLGLMFAHWSGRGLVDAVAGLGIGAGVVLLLSHGYRLVRGEFGMGGGDVLLMAMVGTFLGIRGVFLVFFGGALLGTGFALIKGRGVPAGRAKLPFGTFLAVAAGLTLFFQEPLLDWYWGLMV